MPTLMRTLLLPHSLFVSHCTCNKCITPFAIFLGWIQAETHRRRLLEELESPKLLPISDKSQTMITRVLIEHICSSVFSYTAGCVTMDPKHHSEPGYCYLNPSTHLSKRDEHNYLLLCRAMCVPLLQACALGLMHSYVLCSRPSTPNLVTSVTLLPTFCYFQRILLRILKQKWNRSFKAVGLEKMEQNN